MLKRCPKCEQSKSVTEFHRDSTTLDGLYCFCKACKNAAKKIRYYRTKLADPSKFRDSWKNSQLKRDYGITLNQWNEMFKAQDGKCSICESASSKVKNRSLMVDHDHKTGAVRGLLCGHCNTIIGLASESIHVLKAVIRYLENNSCKSSQQTVTAA